MGLHFLSFWLFRGQLLGSPSQVAKNGPFAQRPYNGFISAVTGSILQFLALWAFISLHLALWAFISLHFGLVGIHFLAFWPCGPISLHFGFFGVSFWAPPTSCQKWPVCPTSLQWIYQRRDRLHFAVFSLVGLHFLAFWPCGPSFPCILALWAFISLHFGIHFAVFSLVGLHFLAFWPCGPSFRCILALWAFISLHFGFVGLHFLAFWPCGPSFPCILALWAFISIHFGLFGVSFWPPPHKLPKMARLSNVLTMDLSAPRPAPFCSF